MVDHGKVVIVGGGSQLHESLFARLFRDSAAAVSKEPVVTGAHYKAQRNGTAYWDYTPRPDDSVGLSPYDTLRALFASPHRKNRGPNQPDNGVPKRRKKGR